MRSISKPRECVLAVQSPTQASALHPFANNSPMTPSNDTSTSGLASAESAPLPIRIHRALQHQHASGSGTGPKLIERRAPHAPAPRGMVTFEAGTIIGVRNATQSPSRGPVNGCSYRRETRRHWSHLNYGTSGRSTEYSDAWYSSPPDDRRERSPLVRLSPPELEYGELSVRLRRICSTSTGGSSPPP